MQQSLKKSSSAASINREPGVGKIVSITKRTDDRILNEIRRKPMPMAHLVASYGFDAVVRLVEQYKVIVEDEMVREATEADELHSDSDHLIKTKDEEGNLDITDVTPIKFFEKLLDKRLQARDFLTHETEYVTFFRRLTQKQLMFLSVMLCNKCQRYAYLAAGKEFEFAFGPSMPHPAEKLLEISDKLEKANLDICAAFRALNEEQEDHLTVTITKLEDQINRAIEASNEGSASDAVQAMLDVLGDNEWGDRD
jgi:hypothetical protein